MSVHPSEWDGAAEPDPWQRRLQHMRDAWVDSCTADELVILKLYAHDRLRMLLDLPDQIIATAGMSPRVKQEADRMNLAGLQRYCQGDPRAIAFAAVAAHAQRAQHDRMFRKFLDHVITAPPGATQ